jgi:hypothetical protein
VSLVAETCCACGVVFAMAEEFYDQCQRAKSRKSFYCPNGHHQHYVGKSDAQKLAEAEERLRVERDNTAFWRGQEAQRQRQLSAARGQVTRIKNRIAGGACPCCNRTFVNLARHMETQHPDFTSDETA